MSAQITRIRATIRSLVDDLSQTHPGDSFTIGTAGASAILTLSETNALAVSSVTLNGAVLASSTYTLSGNLLTVTTTLAVADILIVKYTYYAMYSEAELKDYIKGAFAYIGIECIKNFRIDASATDEISPIPTEKQEFLIAMISSILIKPLKSSYRTATLSVTYPETMSKFEKIKDIFWRYNFDKLGVFELS